MNKTTTAKKLKQYECGGFRFSDKPNHEDYEKHLIFDHVVSMEAASQRALLLRAHSYQSLKSILKRSLDRQTELELEVEKPGPQHDNIRGATYYDPPPTSFVQ